MFDKITLRVYSIIVGIFFLISGIGKVVDTTGFSTLIYNYGLGNLMILAPLIVIIEIGLGISLILLLNPKRDSFIAFVFLVIFTLAFGFAHFARGVNDCGCFGTLQTSNMPPFFTFIRNFILLGISLAVWRKYPKEEVNKIVMWKKLLILSVVGISIFESGFTFTMPNIFHREVHKNKFQNQNIKSTELAKYIETSKDKSYMIFCFSYTCPHCWNSIENLRGFKKSGTVDSIVALSIGDSASESFFNKSFCPDFSILNLPADAMKKLTDLYPTSFYIEHDTIKIVIEGEMPSSVTFKKEYRIEAPPKINSSKNLTLNSAL